MPKDQTVGDTENEGADSQSVSEGTGKPIDGGGSELVKYFEKQSQQIETLTKELRGLQSKKDKGDKQFLEFHASFKEFV